MERRAGGPGAVRLPDCQSSRAPSTMGRVGRAGQGSEQGREHQDGSAGGKGGQGQAGSGDLHEGGLQ